jgi:hypothetical protein
MTVDVPNILRHGWHAPRWSQRISVQPRAVVRAVYGWHDRHSARVIETDWCFHRHRVSELPKIRACWLHWNDGVPWAQTGAYDYMMDIIEERGSLDGCTNIADVRARYQRLDRDFARVRAEGRLRSRPEVAARTFRELGGIRIHLYRGGEPVFSGTGGHRLAMAQILDLDHIPVQLGVVHREVVEEFFAVS